MRVQIVAHVAACAVMFGAPAETLAKPAKLRVVHTFNRADNSLHKPGDPLVKISGGPLGNAVLTVPNWLKYDATRDAFKCALDNDLQLVVLDRRRIYVGQDNLRCGDASKCKIYDAKTKRWSTAICIESPTGARSTIQRVHAGLFFVYGYQEGPGVGQLIRWIPGAGREVLLKYLGPALPKRKHGAVIVESPCHPKTGKLPLVPKSGRCKGKTTCGPCAWNYGPFYQWRWRNGSVTRLGLAP